MVNNGLARTSYSMNKAGKLFAAYGYKIINVNYPSQKYTIETLALVLSQHCYIGLSSYLIFIRLNMELAIAEKYSVRLTEEERTDLESLIHNSKVAVHKRLHAEILLKADLSELGEKWLDSQISETFCISTRTVERVRERWVQEGLESALTRAKSRDIDGEKRSVSDRVSLRRCA